MPAKEIMKDYEEGHLHSGRGKEIKSGKNKGTRKEGKIVKSKTQAKAILLSYLRSEGKIPQRKATTAKPSSNKRVATKT